jgi:transcriptional regulator GlxA family with amidase domain
MKHVSILVPNEAVLASIEDPRYMFTAVNEFLESLGRQPMFHVQLVGLTKDVLLHKGSFTVHADATINDIKRTDLIFVPALIGDMQKALDLNKDFLPWIVRQYQQGAEVASLCIGAFLLASTGLLNGRKCSTHWRSANEFRTMFPEVELVDDRILTEEQGLYTSGGANSTW